MSLVVRYRPTDLGDHGGVETFDNVNALHIHEDNTVEMRHQSEEGVEVIGYLHPHRWESVRLVQEAEV